MYLMQSGFKDYETGGKIRIKQIKTGKRYYIITTSNPSKTQIHRYFHYIITTS